MGQSFIEETAALRGMFRRIVIIIDGYGAQGAYMVLKLFKDSGIAAVGLPAHSSH